MTNTDLHEQSQVLRNRMTETLARLKSGLGNWGISERDIPFHMYRKSISANNYVYYDTARYTKGFTDVLEKYRYEIEHNRIRGKEITIHAEQYLADVGRSKRIVDLKGKSVVDIFSNKETNPFISVCKGRRRGVVGHKAYINRIKFNSLPDARLWDFFKVDFGIYDCTVGTSLQDGANYHQTAIQNETPDVGRWCLWVFPHYMVPQPWYFTAGGTYATYKGALMNVMDFWIARNDTMPYLDSYEGLTGNDYFYLGRLGFTRTSASDTIVTDGITVANNTLFLDELAYSTEANRPKMYPNVIRGISFDAFGFLSVFASSELGNRYEEEATDEANMDVIANGTGSVAAINQLMATTVFINNADTTGPKLAVVRRRITSGSTVVDDPFVVKTSESNPRSDQYVISSIASVYCGLTYQNIRGDHAWHNIIVATSNGNPTNDKQAWINSYNFNEEYSVQLDAAFNAANGGINFFKDNAWVEYANYYTASISDMVTWDSALRQASARVVAVGYDPSFPNADFPGCKNCSYVMTLDRELWEGHSQSHIPTRYHKLMEGGLNGTPFANLDQSTNAPMATIDNFNNSFWYQNVLTQPNKSYNVPFGDEVRFDKIIRVSGRSENLDNPWYGKNDRLVIHSDDSYFVALDYKRQKLYKYMGTSPSTMNRGWVEITGPNKVYKYYNGEEIEGLTSYKNVLIAWSAAAIYCTIDCEHWWTELPLPDTQNGKPETVAEKLKECNMWLSGRWSNFPFTATTNPDKHPYTIDNVKVWNGYMYVATKYIDYYALRNIKDSTAAPAVLDCEYEIFRKKFPIFKEMTEYVTPYDVYKNQEYLDIYGEKRRGYRTNPEFLSGGARFSRSYNLPVYTADDIEGLIPKNVRMTYESILGCQEFKGDMYILKVRFTIERPYAPVIGITTVEPISYDPKTSVRSEIRLERLYPNLTNPIGGTYSEPVFILNRDNADQILFNGEMSSSKFIFNDFLLWYYYDQSGMAKQYIAFCIQSFVLSAPLVVADCTTEYSKYRHVFTVANNELIFALLCVTDKCGVYSPNFTKENWYTFYTATTDNGRHRKLIERVMFTYDGEMFGIPDSHAIYDDTNLIYGCFGHDYQLALDFSTFNLIATFGQAPVVSLCEYPKNGPAIGDRNRIEQGQVRSILISATFGENGDHNAERAPSVLQGAANFFNSSATKDPNSCPYLGMMPVLCMTTAHWGNAQKTGEGFTIYRSTLGNYFDDDFSIPWVLYPIHYIYGSDGMNNSTSNDKKPRYTIDVPFKKNKTVRIVYRKYQWRTVKPTNTSKRQLSGPEIFEHWPHSCGLNPNGFVHKSQLTGTALKNCGIIGYELININDYVFIKTICPDIPLMLYDPGYKFLKMYHRNGDMNDQLHVEIREYTFDSSAETILEPIILFPSCLANWLTTGYDEYFNEAVTLIEGVQPNIDDLYYHNERLGSPIVDIQFHANKYWIICRHAIYTMDADFERDFADNIHILYQTKINSAAAPSFNVMTTSYFMDQYHIKTFWIDYSDNAGIAAALRFIEAIPGRKPIYMNGYWFLPWLGCYIDERGKQYSIPDTSEFSRSEWSTYVASRGDTKKTPMGAEGAYAKITDNYKAMASVTDIYNAGVSTRTFPRIDTSKAGIYEWIDHDGSLYPGTIGTLITLLAQSDSAIVRTVVPLAYGWNLSYYNQFYKWGEKLISITPCKYGYLYGGMSCGKATTQWIDPLMFIPNVDMFQHIAMTDYSGISPKFIHKKVQIQDYEYAFEGDNSHGITARPMTINNKDFFVLDLPFHPTKVIVINRDQKNIISEYPEFYFPQMSTRYLKSGKEVNGATTDDRLNGTAYHAVYIPFKQNAKTIYEINHLDVLDENTGMLPDVESFIDNNRVYIYNPRPTMGPLTKSHVKRDDNTFIKYPGVYKDYLPTKDVTLYQNGSSTYTAKFQKGYQFSTLEIFAWY